MESSMPKTVMAAAEVQNHESPTPEQQKAMQAPDVENPMPQPPEVMQSSQPEVTMPNAKVMALAESEAVQETAMQGPAQDHESPLLEQPEAMPQTPETMQNYVIVEHPRKFTGMLGYYIW